MTIFTGFVRDLSHKGLGVVDHPDGRTFFVRGCWPGDEAEFLVPENAQKYDEVTLLRLLRPSSDRVEIACTHRGLTSGKCGGCPWMMANYASQLRFKEKRLRHALEKRGLQVSSVLQPVHPSPRTLQYRNRVQLKTNGAQLGYVTENSNVFAPVDACLLLNEKLESLFQEVKACLPHPDWRPSGDHHWAYMDLDDGMTLSQVQVNKRRPFRQGNSEQNEKMRAWVKEKFQSLPRHWPIIDLFCGSGNFTEVLSELGFENILAVEVQGSALEELQNKALPGVRVLGLDMTEKGAWAKVARYQPHAKAILIDPPRAGLEKRRGLHKYLDNLEEIFYISCELDTFSRDAADLVSMQWQMQELSPIDLFPHTPHVEILSHFKKK